MNFRISQQKNAPSISGRRSITCRLLLHYRSKFIPVHQHSAFIPVGSQSPRNHLDRHSDLDFLVIQVGQLGSVSRETSTNLTNATVYGALSSNPAGASTSRINEYPYPLAFIGSGISFFFIQEQTLPFQFSNSRDILDNFQ